MRSHFDSYIQAKLANYICLRDGIDLFSDNCCDCLFLAPGLHRTVSSYRRTAMFNVTPVEESQLTDAP